MKACYTNAGSLCLKYFIVCLISLIWFSLSFAILWFIQYLIDKIVKNDYFVFDNILYVILFSIISIIVLSIYFFFQQYFISVMLINVRSQFMTNYFKATFRLKNQNIQAKDSGKFLNLVSNIAPRYIDFKINFFCVFFYQSIIFVGIIVFFFITSWIIGLIVLFFSIVTFLIDLWISSKQKDNNQKQINIQMIRQLLF